VGWLERLRVEVVVGDIFEADTEGMACTVTTAVGPYGAISRQLFSRGGEALAADVAVLRSGLPEGRLELGQAVSLPVRPEHALGREGWLITAALWAHESPYTPSLLYGVHINSLRQAFARALASVAMPIFTGGGAELTFDAITRVLRDLDGLRTADTFSVERLVFVSRKPRDVEVLRQRLEEAV
jgi:O-acetyl-ADP-ribose deacetylase (regulator of RNase III)